MRIMAVHEQIGTFGSNQEDWQPYVEHLKLYCIADTKEKQRVLLLTACGPVTYKMTKNIVALSKSAKKTFDDIINYNQKPTPTVQRC